MLRLPVCLFLISKTVSTNYVQLVADVGDTLAECLDIIDSVGNYVGEVESLNDQRRRAEQEDDNGGTRAKLGACVSILSAVDTYRDNHSKLLYFQTFVPWQEMEILNDFLKPVSKKVGEILYVATMDGDLARDFHNACDGKGPTVVIVESEGGAVFGGYNNLDWKGSDRWLASSTSFLFRLRPSAMKCPLKSGNGKNAILIKPDYGPLFGTAHDLWINSGALSNRMNHVGGNYYSCNGKDNTVLNDGDKYFKIKDYVVLKAISL